MSGGKKTNKAVEMLYQLTKSEDFIKDAERVRAQHGIATGGFDKNKKVEEWLDKAPRQFLLDSFDFAIKHDLPSNNFPLVAHYLVAGARNWKELEKASEESFYIIDPTHKLRNDFENILRGSKAPYVKVLIPEHASKRDVQEALSKKWAEIQEILDRQRKHPRKRIRKVSYKKREERMTELMAQTKEELGIPKHEPKDIGVARILKEEGLTASPEQTRSVPYRKYNGAQKK